MYLAPTSTEDLFFKAQADGLYQKLIAQLNKDFNLANEFFDVSANLLPTDLKL